MKKSRNNVNFLMFALLTAFVLVSTNFILGEFSLKNGNSVVETKTKINCVKENETNLIIIDSTATPIPTPKRIKETIYQKVKMLNKHTITNWNSSNNRNTNMKIAGSIINGKNNKGYLMLPGDSFSWIDVVGQTSADKGFLIAPIIVNGRHAEGLGGGVCQVATTINSAIIKSGLKTKTVKHSANVGYLSERDYEATVSYDSKKDFKFTNTFKFPIMVKVFTKGGTVTVKVFKMKEKTIYYD